MKSKIKSILAAFLMLTSFSFGLVACDDDDNHANVPSEFEAALKQQYPDAKNVEWERKGKYRVAEFVINAVEYDIWYDQSAKCVMTELDYGKNVFLVPDYAVSAAFAQSEYGTWRIDDIKHYKQLNNEFYVFEVEKQGEPDMDVFYNTSGQQLKAIPSDSAPDIRPETVI